MAVFFLVRVVALLAVAGTTNLGKSSTSANAQSTANDPPANVLFIVMDQLRHDAIGIVQSRMASKYSNKVQVRTPNMDRIATELGLMFETAYCQMPSCSPARSTLKTGCTVARHGVTHNVGSEADVYKLVPAFRQRVEALVSFEQILQQHKNYRVETYGRWHTPLKLYKNAVQFNYYSYRDKLFHFAPEMEFRNRYVDSLGYFNKSAYETLERTVPGQTLISRYSTFPYTPIQIDARKMEMSSVAAEGIRSSSSPSVTNNDSTGLETAPPSQFYHYSKENMTLTRTEVSIRPMDATNTRAPDANTRAPEFDANTAAPSHEANDDSEEGGTASFTGGGGGPTGSGAGEYEGEEAVAGDRGRDALAVNYTSTAIEGDMALRALDRLIAEPTSDPFFLSVHFLSPHPPMVATAAYLNYYWSRRANLYVPPSISDPLTYSAYRYGRNRKPGFTDADKLVELVAVYYAMIEEVDHYVGLLLGKLEAAGLLNSTKIVITSDHGEMMGSHGMQGKGLLYEEAARVPLIMMNRRQFPAASVGTVIKEPVSHLDVHATFLDYLGAAQYDTGDGKSLRRFIERNSYNQFYDERTVLVELDGRFPESKRKLAGTLGDRPNFMIRKGQFKLTLPRRADSTVADMMFDLKSDPNELVNLLRDPRSLSVMQRSAILGKAEHLKILLLEFLKRNNGAGKYYSSARYHLGDGRGDMKEISLRRTWERVNYWHSDGRLSFGPPAFVKSDYVRNEYWYVGRTTAGSFRIQSVAVTGTDAALFSVASIQKTVVANRYVRIKVSFRSSTALDWTALNATMEVKNTATGTTRIPLVFE